MKVIADGTKPLFMRMLVEPGQGVVICDKPNDIKLIESICIYFMENAEEQHEYQMWSNLYDNIRITHDKSEEN